MKCIVADSAARLSENDNINCQIGQVIYSAVEVVKLVCGQSNWILLV